MSFKVDTDIDTDKILQSRGLDDNGKIQEIFTREVYKRSEKYIPFRDGILNKIVEIGQDFIRYKSPYARYHWYGKLMVDPITKKGCFFNPNTGDMWSRPGTQKELTDKDMNYNAAPTRGPFWTNRMWTDEGENITEGLAKMAGGRSK